MQRRKFLFGFAAVALLAFGQSTQAAFVSNINITDAGVTTVTGSTVNASVSQVTFGNLFTLAASSPPFTGEQFLALGTATLTVANPTAFTFGTTGFGRFTGVSAVVTDFGPSSETIYVLGNFVVGTDPAYTGLTGGPASFIFTVTQGVNGNYSTSGNLALPPGVSVPEPASIAMLGLGLVAVGGVAARRRSAK